MGKINLFKRFKFLQSKIFLSDKVFESINCLEGEVEKGLMVFLFNFFHHLSPYFQMSLHRITAAA